MRAIIIGGGIGGVAAAIGLERIGCEVAVYEQAPEIREVGAGITLWSNATKALQKLGADRDVLALSVPLSRGQVRTWRGKKLADMTTDKLSARLRTPTIAVHR